MSFKELSPKSWGILIALSGPDFGGSGWGRTEPPAWGPAIQCSHMEAPTPMSEFEEFCSKKQCENQCSGSSWLLPGG